MIIAIAGNREEAGKSTVAKILQYLDYFTFQDLNEKQTCKYFLENDYIEGFGNSKWLNNQNYKIKKFADTLKDFICTLINKDRQWLEENKNTKLEEWDSTPRTLMIQIANNLRETVHPDIWITPLLNQYTQSYIHTDDDVKSLLMNMGFRYSKDDDWCEDAINEGFKYNDKIDKWEFDEDNIEESNWIIDDLRYPNEFKRLKELGSITIYIQRGKDKHTKSEGLLDKDDFDYVIDNNGDIDNLIKQVKQIYNEIDK